MKENIQGKIGDISGKVGDLSGRPIIVKADPELPVEARIENLENSINLLSGRLEVITRKLVDVLEKIT